MPRRADVRARRPRVVPSVQCTLWLAIVPLIALLQSFAQPDHRLNMVAAVVSIVFGVRSFIGHGGPLITVLGLFNYALALFVGVGGVYASLEGHLDPYYLSMAI